jgi:hypothetical protein
MFISKMAEDDFFFHVEKINPEAGPDCKIPTTHRTNQIAPFSSGPACHK